MSRANRNEQEAPSSGQTSGPSSRGAQRGEGATERTGVPSDWEHVFEAEAWEEGEVRPELDADELLCGPESDVRPTLSVVMPTLNEEEGVAECIDRTKQAIEALGVPTEIVLSDSSTDRTPEIGREKGAIVYEPDEGGYGAAYRYAFERARGDYVVMGDADTTYDFSRIPRLLGELRREDADVVMGSRLNGEIEDGAMPALHRYVGNPLLTRFLNAFYDTGVSDAHSGFRIMTREALDTMNLETSGMEFASEMVMEAGAKDLDVVEVPITYHEREGEETLDSFQDGWRHVRFMLMNAPGYLYSVPGILLGSLGIAVMAVSLSGATIRGVNPGVNAMIGGSLLTIVGYQVASLSAFAAAATDPISAPSDPITNRLRGLASLERSATVGAVVGAIGLAYSGWTVFQWLFGGVPIDTVTALVAYTCIVIGIQTVFSSFFASTIAE